MYSTQENHQANVTKNDIEIDFGRILKRLWHFAWLIALLAVIGATVMFAVSKFVLSPQYTSRASIYIHDKSVTTNAGGESEDLNGSLGYNEIGGKAAEYLQNTYTRTLTSNTTLDIVINNLGLNMDANGLRSIISYNVVEYPYMDIIVTCSDPVMAAKIANELADVLYGQVAEIVGGSSLTHVDAAVVPRSKTGPNTFNNVIIGFAAGLVLGCAVIVIIELANNKIYNDEYLITKYNLPVLASISDYDIKARKGYGHYEKYGQ